jgi:hypothetical protein
VQRSGLAKVYQVHKKHEAGHGRAMPGTARPGEAGQGMGEDFSGQDIGPDRWVFHHRPGEAWRGVARLGWVWYGKARALRRKKMPPRVTTPTAAEHQHLRRVGINDAI